MPDSGEIKTVALGVAIRGIIVAFAAGALIQEFRIQSQKVDILEARVDKRYERTTAALDEINNEIDGLYSVCPAENQGGGP